MAFKRYIHKHGKKLGPYYYENLRGRDGSVKTVYLGTNPNNHTRHRIKKPLFFLIVVLLLILIFGSLLFLLQNKSYLIKRAGVQETDFDIDQILLKVLVKSNEFIEKQVRIMNTGSKQEGINVEISGLSDIIKIDSSSFTIKPGQTKVVSLNLSSYIEEQKIEQQPGVYVGKLIVKSQKASKEIPIVVEIETKNVLFDMNLNPVAIERKVNQGSDTTIEVRLFNLQSIESSNVDVEYFVKDVNGNTIVTESESVVVKTQASFFKTVSIPKNLKPGSYTFASEAKFGNSVGTASYLFEVVGPEQEASFVQFCKNSVLCMGLSLTTVLLLFALMAYFYFLIGAYLYEKISGVAKMPMMKKKEGIESGEEEVREQEEGMLERIKNRINEWKSQREQKRAQKESLERERYLKNRAEEEKREQEWQRRGQELRRQREFEAREEELRVLDEKRKKEQELKQQKVLEAMQIEEKKRKQQEKEKQHQETKQKFKEVFHKIGLFKTSEEKAQIALQKERERLEKQRAENSKRKLEEEERKQKIVEENRVLAEQRKKALQRKISKPSKKLQKFYKLMDDAHEALIRDDVSKIDELYTKERDLYVGLPNRERQEVYDKLMEFYSQRNKFLEVRKRHEVLLNKEELKKQKELEKQKVEDEKRKKEQELKQQKVLEAMQIEEKRRNAEEESKKRLEREKLSAARKEKLREFLHKVGFFKTPEEKKQIDLQKERERQEKLRRYEDLKMQKEAEKKRAQLEDELTKQEQLRKKLELERKKAEEEMKKEQEIRKQHQLARKQEDASEKEPKEKKAGFFEKMLKKKKSDTAMEESKKEPEKEPISELSGIFGKLFEKAKKSELPKEQKQKPKNEADELEEAIRGLGLFKEMEKGRLEIPKKKPGIFERLLKGDEKEAHPEEEKKGILGSLLGKNKSGKEPKEERIMPEEKIFGMPAVKAGRKAKIEEEKPKTRLKSSSRKSQKCLRALDEAKEAIGIGNPSKARKFYIEARKIYIGLDYHEKTDIYNELMEIYNKLMK